MITQIEIEGYKSIKSLQLELQPINILLGGNGVGKSNFISVFSFLYNIDNFDLESYVQKKGGADSLLHFGSKNTSEINLTIHLKHSKGVEFRYSVNLQTGNDSLFVNSMKVSRKFDDKWIESTYQKNEHKPFFAFFPFKEGYQRLFEFDVYHFHDTSDTSAMKKMTNIHNNEHLQKDGSNIAAFLYYLQEKEPKHFKRIELTIQSIAPFFERFDLKPNRLNEQKIQLEWREKGFPDNYFNAYHLSDGTLRFICLATLLMQPNPPKTIVIDEPELGLHPVAINKLATLIRKASAKTQIILSTQSINLIDNFEPEDIIVTDRKNHESVFRRLKSEDLKAWLEEYTLGDLWGKNKFGAQPYSV